MIYRYLALLSVLYLVTKVVKNPLKAKEMEFFLLLKDTAQNRADYGFAFARQKPILNYIADFYCKELNIVVEIDGASHFSAEAYLKDKERDRQMRVLGLEILRVLDSDVRKDADQVARFIEEQCKIIQGREGE